jgi:methyltransferase (TIGR00027 family)
MTTSVPIQDVSETALMVAMWRARENEHPKPLFRDPFAAKLAGERGRQIIAGLPKRRAFMSHWMMAIRTAIIDEMIRKAIAEGVDTILNLGAGLDTRPYRMDLPGDLLWIEVDYPKIIELKEERLSDETPVCRLERIRGDVADSATRRALFRTVSSKATKALVLTEGVIPYFTDKDVGALADDLQEHAAFRYWIADYISPFALRYRHKEAVKRRMENAPFLFEPKDFFGFFMLHGWRAKETRYLVDAAEKFGRPAPAVMRGWFWLRGLFVSAQTREEMRNFTAYVLFEPVRDRLPASDIA